MARSVVVVESPAKAKTIQKILGKGFQVLSSMGHVKDLPKSRLGVDVEHGFAPSYVVIKDRKKVLQGILESARSADAVYLAPDPDREGEAIAWHIADSIREDAGKKGKGGAGKKGKGGAGKRNPAAVSPEIRRVLFHEITKKGISQGMAHPRPLDRNRFDAQQARRILDRIVGYSLSPLLWSKVRRGLSAGRVQSVAVKMVCGREREIAAFVPEEYWSLTARFEGAAPPPFPARLVEAGGSKVRPRSEPETLALRAAVENGPFVVREVRKKLRRRLAPAPFTTSKLQQEASKALRMQAYRTMMVAQSLYEGVEIPGSGLVGLITYMRTDSVRVADEAVAAVREYVRGAYGEAWLPEAPNVFRNRKSAQDAHEAIRPTSMEYPPAALKRILNRDQLRLYELIWRRFVASQMAAAEFEQTTVDIACKPPGAPAEGYLFRAVGSVPKFSGFLEAYPGAAPGDRGNGGNGEGAGEGSGGNGEVPAEAVKGEEAVLPPLTEGEVLSLLSLTGAQHFTQPPPRFSESSLIKELEEQGIGRPSTYAAIVKTIRDRGYVKVAEGRFVPTELGTIVTGLLEESFPKVMDVAFTARMEEELDRIEDGERELAQAMEAFYQPFSEELERAKIAMPAVKEELIATGIPCSACGGEMLIRFGRAGKFLACRNYPACRNTADFRETPEGKVEILPPEEAGVDCDKCGKPMVVRSWKGARYIACSGYPDCRNSRPFPVGVSCPECAQGDVAERSSRFGKLFYSCSRYPECRFASWGKPVAAVCPACGYPAMSERVRRDGTTQLVCLRKGCKGRGRRARGRPGGGRVKEYVLAVDDEQSLRRLLELFFRKEGFEVDTAGSLAEAEQAIGANAYDLVLTDLRMAGEDDGLKVLRAALQKNPWTQVIVLTAYGTVETAKEAIKYGAYDYIAKPFDNAELRKIVRSALARKEDDAGRRKALRESVRGTSAYEGIVGRSEAMLGIFELIDRVAPTDANVMILGESGTGKELVAAALHNRSNRREQPFVPINCAAIPETLLESELFGHVRGAFTGAVQTKKGLFEAAHRGTLFLDEVGELPLPMQGKLLRALQERVFRRVGGNEDISIDFRTVCASKRDLHREMAEGRFRDDLYFRLNVIQIFVPPLRDRREDIPALAAHFLRKFAQKHGKPIERIDGEAMRALLAHDFPGNVRELENILERATIMETKNVISLDSLPPNVTKIVTTGRLAGDEIQESFPEEGVFLDQAMDRLEKKHLLKALESTGGNRTEAAKLLNITLRSLRYRLQKHGIE